MTWICQNSVFALTICTFPLSSKVFLTFRVLYGCFVTGIWRCASLSCEHHCHSSPDGGTCACPPGYVVSRNDSRSCIGKTFDWWLQTDAHIQSNRWFASTLPVFCADYNDCSLWGMCDQLCEDRIGSHRCSCRDGYLLEQHKYCRTNPSCESLQASYMLSSVYTQSLCLMKCCDWFTSSLFVLSFSQFLFQSSFTENSQKVFYHQSDISVRVPSIWQWYTAIK